MEGRIIFPVFLSIKRASLSSPSLMSTLLLLILLPTLLYSPRPSGASSDYAWRVVSPPPLPFLGIHFTEGQDCHYCVVFVPLVPDPSSRVRSHNITGVRKWWSTSVSTPGSHNNVMNLSRHGGALCFTVGGALTAARGRSFSVQTTWVTQDTTQVNEKNLSTKSGCPCRFTPSFTSG